MAMSYLLSKATKVLEWAIALSLLSLIVLTFVDVVGRYLFNSPVPGAFEYVRILMGIVVFGAMPLASARNAHLRAGMLDHFIPERVNAVREPFVQLVSASILGLILWRLAVEAQSKWQSKEVFSGLTIPLWMPITYMAVLSLIALVATLAVAVSAGLGMSNASKP
jgi:TRAP-type C4-dicarboxylate transport system permease small subunit